jgi:hypothetical protein
MSEPAGWSADAFLAELASIPWFENVGKPVPSGSGVKCISTWEEWPGPEDPPTGQLFDRQQLLHDSIMSLAGNRREALAALWDRIANAVRNLAAPHVPYDPEQDSWHGPTMAVWHAGWTAGLIALCRETGRPVPPELQELWQWFVRGHWPCGFTCLVDEDESGPLLVF